MSWLIWTHGTNGTTATEESGVPGPATGNLGSIHQKIRDLLGKFRHFNNLILIPTFLGFFAVMSYMFLNFQTGKVVLFLKEYFLKGVDFHEVYRTNMRNIPSIS